MYVRGELGMICGLEKKVEGESSRGRERSPENRIMGRKNKSLENCHYQFGLNWE